MPSALLKDLFNEVSQETEKQHLLEDARSVVRDLAEYQALREKLHRSNIAWLFVADVTAKVAKLLNLDPVEQSARALSDGRSNDEIWSWKVRHASLESKLERKFYKDDLKPENILETQRDIARRVSDKTDVTIDTDGTDIAGAMNGAILEQEYAVTSAKRPVVKRFQELLGQVLPRHLVEVDAMRMGEPRIKGAYFEMTRELSWDGNSGFVVEAYEAERKLLHGTREQSLARDSMQQQTRTLQTQTWDLYRAPTPDMGL